MRTLRQQKIDRAIVRVVNSLPVGILLPDHLLRAEVGMHVVPEPTAAELDDALRHADTQRRIEGIDTETGRQWQITDTGRLWHTRNP